MTTARCEYNIYILFRKNLESCHFIYIFLKYFLPFLLLKSWLLICNVIINQSSPPISLDVEKSYNGISRYNHTKLVLSPDGMREMKTILLFHQLRLHCCKQQNGRTFHVKTAINASGGAVVGFFGGDRRFPKACDSFEKLKGDNSVLASRCVEWGRENGVYHVGKWGHEGKKELYIYPAFIVGMIIGSLGEVLTYGNVMARGKICRAATFGRFMFVN